jgi:flagellar biosynthesis GTPase FlhF
VPYFLIIALVTHIGSLTRSGANEEAPKIAQRRISWFVIVGATLATFVLLSWVTLMRLDVIDEEGRASIARYEAAEIAGLVPESNNIRIKELTGGTIFGNAGFIQHQHIVRTTHATDETGNPLLNDLGYVQTQYVTAFGYYLGHMVHRIMLIAAWTTTAISMLLSFFYFKAFWWREKLVQITDPIEAARIAERNRETREEAARRRAEREREREDRRRRRALEREEKRQRKEQERDEKRKRKYDAREAERTLRRLEKEERQRLLALRVEIKRRIKLAFVEMKEDQKRAEQEMEEARLEMKKVQHEGRLEGGLSTPKMKKLKNEMERTRAEEIATSANCERERSERDKSSTARRHLMAELWEDLNCFGEIPATTDEFTGACHREILMRELLSMEANYVANLQDLYGGIKAEFNNYKAELANMAADELVGSQIIEIDIDEVIRLHNSNPELADVSLHLRQWNTQQSRNALLAGFREMMGLQDINPAA